jgi:hypothetical protein
MVLYGSMFRYWKDPTEEDVSLSSIAPPKGMELVDHILLCGDGDGRDDVPLFVYAYRSLGASNPIVILAPDDPWAWWYAIGNAKDVYFLKGSATIPIDLLRANASAANSIIVLNIPSVMSDLEDSSALYITILAELVNSKRDADHSDPLSPHDHAQGEKKEGKPVGAADSSVSLGSNEPKKNPVNIITLLKQPGIIYAYI